MPELLLQHARVVTIGETKWGWLALASSTFRSQVCDQPSLVALLWTAEPCRSRCRPNSCR